MDDEEKWKRCLNAHNKARLPIGNFKGAVPLCKVYATWVGYCKTCPWYNSHLLEWDYDKAIRLFNGDNEDNK